MKIEVAAIDKEQAERADQLGHELELHCIQQFKKWQIEFPDLHPDQLIFWTAMACAHAATSAMHAMYEDTPGHDPQRLYKALIKALNDESQHVYHTLIAANQ